MRARWLRVALAVTGALSIAGGQRTAIAQEHGDIAGRLQDAIVGVWTGTAKMPDADPFEVRLTFVSPKGGISRYPGDPPCGGVLVGDRKGDTYEFKETITYNGTDEKTDGCITGATMRMSVDGDSISYDWAASYDGQDYTVTGELKRQQGGKQR
jgi:hypothetical protein